MWWGKEDDPMYYDDGRPANAAARSQSSLHDPRPQNPPDYYPPKPDRGSEAWAESELDRREAADAWDVAHPTATMDHGGAYRWDPKLGRVVIVKR